MNKQIILKADYLDIVFDNRNKKYGGYELRKNYPTRARNAMMFVTATVVLAFVAPLLAFNTDKPVPPPRIKVDSLVYISQPPPPIQPKVDPPKFTQSTPAPTQTFVAPKVVDDHQVIDNQLRPVDSGHVAGPVDNPDGDPTKHTPDLNLPKKTGPETVVIPPPVAPKKYVSQMPEFNGDLNGYLNHNLRYPDIARENGVEGRVVVQFVVNEEGNITDAEVVRSAAQELNKEALRVINAMPKWKPGKDNGTAVKVYYTLPITFKLD